MLWCIFEPVFCVRQSVIYGAVLTFKLQLRTNVGWSFCWLKPYVLTHLELGRWFVMLLDCKIFVQLRLQRIDAERSTAREFGS